MPWTELDLNLILMRTIRNRNFRHIHIKQRLIICANGLLFLFYIDKLNSIIRSETIKCIYLKCVCARVCVCVSVAVFLWGPVLLGARAMFNCVFRKILIESKSVDIG